MPLYSCGSERIGGILQLEMGDIDVHVSTEVELEVANAIEADVVIDVDLRREEIRRAMHSLTNSEVVDAIGNRESRMPAIGAHRVKSIDWTSSRFSHPQK